MRNYLVELDVFDPSLGGVRTLCYASVGFTSGPAESPASTFYDGRVEQAVTIGRSLFGGQSTYGRSVASIGSLVLSNADGALDGLTQFGFDGQAVRVLRGRTGRPLSEYDLVFAGTTDTYQCTERTIEFALRDNQVNLDQPIQTNRYRGDNALPNGLEGTSELKDIVKPLLYGRRGNFAPKLVNTSKLIYQAHDGALSSVEGVRDRGIPLTDGGTYASEADLLNDGLAPAPGEYKAYLAGGYVRLGASPDGTVTMGATEGTAATRTCAQTAKAIWLRMGVDASDIIGSAVSALDTAVPGRIGRYITDDVKASVVLDEIATTCGAWWGVTASNGYVMRQLVKPVFPDIGMSSLANDTVTAPIRKRPTDSDRGLPTYETTLRYAQNDTVQTDLAATVSDAMRALYAQARASTTTTDASVKNAHPLSPSLTFDTLFVDEADATAECQRRQLFRGVQRHLLEVRIPFNDETKLIDVGDVLGIAHPRFVPPLVGDDRGQPTIVIGVRPDAQADMLDLTLWGAALSVFNLAFEDGDLMLFEDSDYFLTEAA